MIGRNLSDYYLMVENLTHADKAMKATQSSANVLWNTVYIIFMHKRIYLSTHLTYTNVWVNIKWGTAPNIPINKLHLAGTHAHTHTHKRHVVSWIEMQIKYQPFWIVFKVILPHSLVGGYQLKRLHGLTQTTIWTSCCENIKSSISTLSTTQLTYYMSPA